MGGGKGDAPDAPDYDKLVAGSLESAQLWESVARDQLEWAKTQDASNREVLERVLGVQLPQMEEAFKNAQADRQRYEDTYQPVEDDLVREFKTIGTEQDKERYAAQRMADVGTQFDAQRRNQQRALEDYGIDPSETRAQALDLGFRAEEAAAKALAANQGREGREQLGRALRSEAINIGRGYPAQVAQSQATVNQTAGGAVNNATGVTNTGVNAYGSAGQYGQLGQGAYGQAANIQNMGYQNSLQQYNANAGASGTMWGGIGSLAGTAVGAYFGGPWGAAAGSKVGGSMGGGGYMAEGGEVPEDASPIPQPGDDIPVMLSENEFIIPADVVKKKGTEFFDKLLDKFKEGGEYDQKRQQAIPAG